MAAARLAVKRAPCALGGVMPGIDLDKALTLADALEDQEIAAKLGRRKRSWFDANLLIYDRFRFAAAPSGADLTRTYALRHGCAGLPWIAILALIRITTRAGIMRRPLSPPVALAYLQSWLEQPCVEAVVSGEHHRAILRRLLEATGVAGNLASDAHLGALALERGAYVSSADHEFARFPGSTHVDPMAR